MTQREKFNVLRAIRFLHADECDGGDYHKGMNILTRLTQGSRKRKLPTLSDGKKRWVTSKEYARLESLAIAANKPLREFLELGGGEEKKGKLKL